MTGTVPESLQDEFTQQEWDNLTEAEREGMLEGEDDNPEPTPDEQRLQDDADKAREDAALAAAKKDEPAATEKTAEQLEADAAEPQAPTTPRPRGVIDAALPEDYDKRVEANEQAQAELDKKYDDGDISHTEWRAELRRLDRESRDLEKLKDRAELAQESSQQALMAHWQGLIQPFLGKHPELGEDQVSMDGFDAYLKATTGPVMEKGGTPGQAEIDKAYTMWCKRFNFTPVGEQQAAAPAGKKQVNVPPTLGGVPVAAGNAVEDGKWAAIDRLEGTAYEEAIAKLSPAEYDAYAQRA